MVESWIFNLITCKPTFSSFRESTVQALAHNSSRRYPESGGAFRVQVYSPYLVINKTGLPFGVRSTRSTRATPPQEAAGDTRIGKFPVTAFMTISFSISPYQMYYPSRRPTVSTIPQASCLVSHPTKNKIVLSHPHDRGHEFIFKIGDAQWSKVHSLK